MQIISVKAVDMNIAIAGFPLILALIGMGVALIALVLILKQLFSRKSEQRIAQILPNESNYFSLVNRNKYIDVDTFQYSNTFSFLGFAVSLGIMVLIFGWTQFEKTNGNMEIVYDLTDADIIEIPRTIEPPKPPPPPPPPPVIEPVPEEFIEDQEVEFIDQLIEEDTEITAPPAPKKALPPPPPPPPIEEVEGDFILIPEQMPRFPGCEDMAGTNAEKKLCADRKLFQFIGQNINYPPIARENGIEGTCFVQFIVNKDGTLQDAKILRDIGGGCGEEALRVVNLINKKGLKWTPGKQRGRAVRVQFNLPVKFVLN